MPCAAVSTLPTEPIAAAEFRTTHADDVLHSMPMQVLPRSQPMWRPPSNTGAHAGPLDQTAVRVVPVEPSKRYSPFF